MTSDRVGGDGKQKPANDNRLPEGKGAAGETDVSERLDRVVLTIARLIGRQIAREHFEALQAANDNGPPDRDERAPGAEDED